MSLYPTSDKEAVYTSNPEREIWNFIRSFESEHYVGRFAENRISKNFDGFPFSTLKTAKETHNATAKDSRHKTEILPLLKSSDISSILTEVSNETRQAFDFYNKSKELPLLSRPILLHYAFEKLASVLILLTYYTETATYSHGLTFRPGRPIEVKSTGLFQRFHDCYSPDPSIYLGNHAFTFDWILDGGEIYDYHIRRMMEQNKIDRLMTPDAATNERIALHELDREFLFIFALSVLARYRVIEWVEIIEGKKSDRVTRIERYLESVQMLFPNLILNVLRGRVMLFYEPAKAG